jgi:PAS domain S-box-containing protein
MKDFSQNTLLPSLVRRYISVLIAVWTLIVAASLVWSVVRIKEDTMESARIQAHMSYEKDMVYRRWNAGHGGVYVPVTKETTPNTYLSNVRERDVITQSGRILTLINPAYMTRQVYQLMEGEFGIQGHITSLNPVSPENSPDSWESDALRACEHGAPEVSSVSRINGKDYFRMMHPFVVEPGCLKCHARDGYRKGDIRGGISVSIPMAPLTGIERSNIVTVSVVHSLLWITGLIGLTWGRRNLGQREKERMQFVEVMQKEKVRAQTYLDISAVMFVALDNMQNVTMINNKGCEFLGLDETEIVGKNWFDNFVPDKVSEEARAVFVGAMSGETELPEYLESRILTESGEERLVAWHNILLKDESGNITGTLGSGEDITERRLMEESLKRSFEDLEMRVKERTLELSEANMKLRMNSEQLRNLFIRLQSARESEKALLSREIHDEFGTVLTALKIDLSWLEKKLPDDDEAAKNRVKNDMRFVSSAIREVQRISTELRPGMLDHLGLGAAVEWQVKEFSERTGIDYDMSVEMERTIPDKDLSTAVFRIFQEVLTNVVRHANASRIRVHLEEKDGCLLLKVDDDGKGISETEISDACSLGLGGIRESVRVFGGKVEITGIPNKGTSVSVSVPLEISQGPEPLSA